MKRIRLLKVTFNSLIKSYEIPAFRGAIAKKAGKDSVLFHNHYGEKGFNYGYPLIQYKTIAQKPVIMCLEEGVDEIHHFFENKIWDIQVSGRNLDMSIDDLRLNSFTMQVWDKKWKYSIRNWIALNQHNYQKYQSLENEQEQIKMLEKLLLGNILSFAKGIGWFVDKEITVEIDEIHNISPVKLKNNNLIGFSLTFRTNVFLPNFIGLGKGVSHGYGIVKEVRNKINKNIHDE